MRRLKRGAVAALVTIWQFVGFVIAMLILVAFIAWPVIPWYYAVQWINGR